jgi:hypothetical protein
MKLTLTRQGEFAPVNMRENPTDRCGIVGMTTYKYTVHVEATDDSLSKEGFVIENSRLHNYFLTRYCSGRPWNAISCERMAIKGAMEIGRTLIKENISVTAVKVTMVGSNNAQIEAVWTRDNEPKKSTRTARRGSSSSR